MSVFRRTLLSILFLFSTASVAARSQATLDFSGMWKQDNDRSTPKRSGDVTLRIEHHGPKLTVETATSRKGGSPRHAVQNYTTDGKISVSTGADGDEFHTSITQQDATLIFSIEEREGGRILRSKEIWYLIEDGATLERIRERPDGDKQLLFFHRVPLDASDGRSVTVKAAAK